MENLITTTKSLIMEAAEKLFPVRGFTDTKIADISAAVGVSDSTVYEHFQNKEDILFAIPNDYTQRLIEINASHLRGIRGAEAKLSKLIWNYLDFLVENKDYTTLLLFELRPNRDFYETDNYALIREFTRPYREAIVEGQREGDFRSEISPSLVLNLIFGTIDLILITWIVKNEPKSPLETFDDMVTLFQRAIRKQPSDSNPKQDKRKRILDAATKVFSEKGYTKSRIQDIANQANVADATIYKYFKSKEDILFNLPIEHTKELISLQAEHLHGLKDTDLKLSSLIKDYILFLNNHKEYSSICLFDLRYNKLFYQTEAYDLFRAFSRVFYGIIVEGIRKSHFISSVNPIIATKMIFGIIDHVVLSWIKFGNPNRVTNLSDQICTLILNSLKY